MDRSRITTGAIHQTSREKDLTKGNRHDAACKMHLIIYYGFGRCLGLICLSTCLRILCVFTLEVQSAPADIGSGEFWEVIKAFTLELSVLEVSLFRVSKNVIKILRLEPSSVKLSTPVRSLQNEKF